MEMQPGSKHTTSIPRWDLSSIYPSFDSPEYERDKTLLRDSSSRLLELLSTELPSSESPLAERILAILSLYEEAGDLAENLEAYASAIYTTDTRNARSLAEINTLEALSLPLGKAAVLFRAQLSEREDLVRHLASGKSEVLSPYAFYLLESLERSEHQMSPDLEDLANDLSRSGGDAWSRLQEAISSTATAVWDEKTGERKTVIALRDLAFDASRPVREKAYRAELAAWKSSEIPLAAALNGVKGTSISLDTRRAWENAIDKACFQGRLSRKALNALLGAMEESLPIFRRYLKAKAPLIGTKTCAFYDLFAPVGSTVRVWTWEETSSYIVDRFSSFDPAMGAFAQKAFNERWIDAEGRDGKVGGAYCTDFPLQGDSRILCNFEGSFSSLTTVAHELGHAWHHEVIKDMPRSLSGYPMTLAETASIFAETIVFEDALSGVEAKERLALIEGNLQDSCQVIVDILSRFRFESALFSKRAEAELAPLELCEMMLEAQKSTYGDALDSELLHPYMWAVKGHYYRPGLAFYNFPYAFGLLFALGLYARAQKEGPSFAGTYRDLLRMTGRASAIDVALSAGFDIEDAAFWQGGIALITSRVEEFERLAKDAK
ncbi:M3 family oligoendopeptidase [Treponema sp.]